jgi:hypothetical protein
VLQDKILLVTTDSACASLAKDAAVRTARAEFLYSRGDAVAAYKECHGIMQQDPRSVECMGVNLACMVELGKKNELFQLGHRCAYCWPLFLYLLLCTFHALTPFIVAVGGSLLLCSDCEPRGVLVLSSSLPKRVQSSDQ